MQGNSLSSWVDVPDGSDFTIHNLPYGVFSTEGSAPRCGVAIGDSVLDLAAVSGLFADVPGLDATCFSAATLNRFMAHPHSVWVMTRARLLELLRAGGAPDLREDGALRSRALLPRGAARMHLPAEIGDYTDFYSSRAHAYNCGCMLRSPENALQPNWLHMPVCYHGRASSVFVSGTPVVRPCGQLARPPGEGGRPACEHGASRQLDFELETAFFFGGPPTAPGETISLAEADRRIFGLVLMNDWSARDIQAWEMVPLGPFGSKNFATSISPWIVPLLALEPFRCSPADGPTQHDPAPLPYLRDPDHGSSAFDISLTASVQGAGMPAPETVARSNHRNLYWNIRQQLAHHAVTGCVMRPGDLLGSGTISGAAEDARGCLLEASWRGTRAVPLGSSGESRTWLVDGDVVTLAGRCERPGGPALGFGVVTGAVLPARPAA